MEFRFPQERHERGRGDHRRARAYIGGCAGTACAITDKDYGIVALGTMSHSWVQMYPDSIPLSKYTEIYPGQLRLCGGHLQCAEIRRSCGDQGIRGK